MLANAEDTAPPGMSLPPGAVMLSPQTVHLLICTAEAMAHRDGDAAVEAAERHADVLAVVGEASVIATDAGAPYLVSTVGRSCCCGQAGR